jgi:hypothetical protein
VGALGEVEVKIESVVEAVEDFEAGLEEVVVPVADAVVCEVETKDSAALVFSSTVVAASVEAIAADET